MGRVAAIGTASLVQGFALAGVVAMAAETAEEVRHAWGSLAPDVVLVFLTPPAAEALGARIGEPSSTRLTAVLPP
ncbi:MAG TPA: V-type ATP synthase subunit F [Blastococcus sp.]|jgi:vacuolar-type H+-ATPase subunit F/Vma7|nr:V-type ATP synthase subunit F [Blastococcus sp.]